MSRIKNAFLTKAKVAYLTAGDGACSADYFIALAKGGANILEIGIPFSDPIADGIVIQEAMNRALATHSNLSNVFEIVDKIRHHTDTVNVYSNRSSIADVAIILFTYYNPIFGREDSFLQQAKQAGVDGVLVVDMPYEESLEFRALAKKYDIDIITVIATSTTAARIKHIATHSTGFLYYACQRGTTGVRNTIAHDLKEKINLIRENSTLPIAVGFGVSNNDMVHEILYEANADGCVIGSYFVNAIQNGATPDELESITRAIYNGQINRG
jgi:tryptophan synthase alpha chain